MRPLVAIACEVTLLTAAAARARPRPEKAPDQLSGYKLELRAPGESETAATAVNALGTVVGTAGVHHAFVWQDGQFTIFDAPGATSTVPRGIDEQGTIVGACWVKDENVGVRKIGFVRHPDARIETFDNLAPYPGVTGCAVVSIASGGEMYATQTSAEATWLFRGRPGAWTEIEKDAYQGDYGAFNAAGAYVWTGGAWGSPPNRLASLHWKQGKKEKSATVEYPGADMTIGVGLNDKGEVVGRSGTSKTLASFYRDVAGNFYWYAPSGALGSGANGISSNGYIVGYDQGEYGTGVGWLYRPGPRRSETERSIAMRWAPAGERPSELPLVAKPDPPPPPPAEPQSPPPPSGPAYDGLIDRLAAELDPAVERKDFATVLTQAVLAYASDTTRWEPYLYLGMAERHLLLESDAYVHLDRGIALAQAELDAHPDRDYIKPPLATMYLERSWRGVQWRDIGMAERDVARARALDPGPRVDRQECILVVILEPSGMGGECERAAQVYSDDPTVRAGRGMGHMWLLRQVGHRGAPDQWQAAKADFEFFLQAVPENNPNIALIQGYLKELDALQ
jgi:probable HAF family extracellular repeat protein